LNQGKIVRQGTYEDLLKEENEFSLFLKSTNSVHDQTEDCTLDKVARKTRKDQVSVSQMAQEERQRGHVLWPSYCGVVAAAGGLPW
jgi:hypothetical protein